MTVRIGVVAHPLRRAMAGRLARDVDADWVSWDCAARRGCEQNHVAALRHIAEPGDDAQWYVILEDDAVPCAPLPEFRTQLDAALGQAPTPLVGLYLGRGNHPGVRAAVTAAIGFANDAQSSWIEADALMAGVAYAVHRSVVHRMLAVIDNPADPAELPKRITRWAQRAFVRTAYTWPSLVDHHDGYSIIAGTRLEVARVAYRTGTREQWTRRSTPMEPLPGWSAP